MLSILEPCTDLTNLFTEAANIAYFNEPPQDEKDIEDAANKYEKLVWEWQALWQQFSAKAIRTQFTPWLHVFVCHAKFFLCLYGSLRWWSARVVEAVHNPVKLDLHQKGMASVPVAVA